MRNLPYSRAALLSATASFSLAIKSFYSLGLRSLLVMSIVKFSLSNSLMNLRM